MRIDAAEVKRTVSILGLLPAGAPVKKTGSAAWITTCLFHDDSTPSMGVFLGDHGWRYFCHGCGAKGSVIDFVMQTEGVGFLEALGLLAGKADVRAKARPVPMREDPKVAVPIAPKSVHAHGAALRWLVEVRKFSPAEAASMFSTPDGRAVAFRYATHAGVIYEKFRTIVGKDFWRLPSGTPSLLYGLERVPAGDVVVVTEGELDVHALRSAGVICATSVPDGCGSSVRSDLLAPLARFQTVLIATDRDDGGHALARRIVEALGRERCRRVTFGPWKDANDALRAGWSATEFRAAFAAAKDFPADDGGAKRDPMRKPKGPKTAAGHRGSDEGSNGRVGSGPRAVDGPVTATRGRTSRAVVGDLNGSKGAEAAPPHSHDRARGVRPQETREDLPVKALATPAHGAAVMNGCTGVVVSQAGAYRSRGRAE